MKLKLSLATLFALLLMTLLGSSNLPFVSTPVDAAPPPRDELLTDIPVTGDLVGGGTFDGVLSVTSFDYDDGDLLVSGILSGTATLADGTTQAVEDVAFTDVVADLLSSENNLVCSILNLDLGPLDLDVLGLVIELSDIQLDITAVTGPGRLLGNLLCALVGILDGGGPLSQILRILDRINAILN